MKVYENGLLKLEDGHASDGPNLVVGGGRRTQLSPYDVEQLRDALTEWLWLVGREREAA